MKGEIFKEQTGNKYDMRFLLLTLKEYEEILVDLGPWASVGLDTADGELKGILERVVDASVQIVESRGEKEMRILLLLVLLSSCVSKHLRLKVGDCFEVPTEKATFFKVRSVLKHSYMAGRYSGVSTGKKFHTKYPAMQLTSVSFQELIYRTDCVGSKEWEIKWVEAILNEYEDRKQLYTKDVVIPKENK